MPHPIHFRGGEYTQQQMARFLEETDRQTRQEAWEASTSRRLRDREPIEALFDTILPLRQRIADNAGTGDFRTFLWKAL